MERSTRYAKGTIWYWCKSEPIKEKCGVQSNGRPVLVVSNNTFNASSPMVNIATFTTRKYSKAPNPCPIIIREKSYCQIEQITSVAIEELGGYIGTVSDRYMRLVESAIAAHLELSKQKSEVKNVEI